MLDISTLPPGRVVARLPGQVFLSPHPALQGCVAHYTLTFLEAGEKDDTGTLTLLPDASGCLVFTLRRDVQAAFWGATTRAATVARSFGDIWLRFFVEFLPGGAHRLLGAHMEEFADTNCPFAFVHAAVCREMVALLESHREFPALLAGVDDLLLRQLACNEDVNIAATLLPLLVTQCGAEDATAPAVRSLADASGYSERHLNRLFRKSLGISVKGCARVLRVNHVLRMLRPGVSLLRLAQQAGYYDQPHFNHEFKLVCGVSPSEYLAGMSDFYKEEYKF